MNTANPTGLRLGQTGTIVGKRFHVAGRVVMGMEDGGETYYWNEFHLVEDSGQSATLVYEDDGDGTPWKLFTYVEPAPALTAAEAATKRVGDTVDLDGASARVTLVDESRVCFIEGRPPEGVEAGDVANYFNALAGNRLLVVSWTGDEVEVFRGLDLPTHAVTGAFGLPTPVERFTPSPVSGISAGISGNSFRWIVQLLVAGAALWLFVGRTSSCRTTLRPTTSTSVLAPVPTPRPAPPALLATGDSGTLAGKHWRVASHNVVEIRTMKSVHERHEYRLVGYAGMSALLVFGHDPGKTDWWLFHPIRPDAPLTPREAGAKRTGQLVAVTGEPMRITELFQSTIQTADGESPLGVATRATSFGFRANGRDAALLARWTEGGIEFHLGKPIPAKDVTAAFKPKPRDAK